MMIQTRFLARVTAVLAIGLGLVLAGCSAESGPSTDALDDPPADGGKPYVVVSEDLEELIADFNEHAGKVRQVYIIGPSCGICLRGMVDMQEALVADRQDDPRLQTLVVHVPALGAEERHVEPTIQLLHGPRVRHYWDGAGHSGLEFQEALGLPTYAWDVWLVYGPEARWNPGEHPPEPEFWQHQLGGLDRGSKLDPERFAAEVNRRVEALEIPAEGRIAAKAPAVEEGLIRVAQPRGYVIQQHLMERGTYPRLRSISSMRFEGSLDADGNSYPLAVVAERPDRRLARLQTDNGVRETEVEDGRIRRSGAPVIPPAVADPFLHAFEFDGWLMEWKDKGHKVWRLGMVKDDDRLPWLMEVEHRNGQTWHLYLDSHTGDVYRRALVNEGGEETIALEYGDFRDVDGFRIPHRVTWFDGEKPLAVERYDHVQIVREEPAE